MTEIENEIIESIKTTEAKKPEFLIATIGEVSDDGVTLIFPGEDSATEKKYKCNSCVTLKAGDRVKITKESGSCIVDYPIGTPGERAIPSEGTNGQFLMKTETGVQWADGSGYDGPTINGEGTTSLGFFGKTATGQKRLYTNIISEGYNNATSSNYLKVLNNVCGILIELGFISG